MKILITGAAGYIGSNCAIHFAKAGHKVHGIDNLNDFYSPEIKAHTKACLERDYSIEIHKRDLCSDTIQDLIEESDVIIHFAAQPGISATTSWKEYYRNNVLATHNLVAASSKTELTRFVNISTSSVYGLNATGSEDTAPQPASWYGVSKLAAEQEVLAAYRSSGFSACSIRPFSVYGERERPEKLFARLVKSAFNGESFTLYEGAETHSRAFTYVGDLCQAIEKTLANWDRAVGRIFNIGTESSISTLEAIKTVERVIGKSITIEPLPSRPGDQNVTKANIQNARRLLDWQPNTSLEEGVTMMVEWYESEIHGKFDWV